MDCFFLHVDLLSLRLALLPETLTLMQRSKGKKYNNLARIEPGSETRQVRLAWFKPEPEIQQTHALTTTPQDDALNMSKCRF